MSLDDRLVSFDWSNALESFKPASALPEPPAGAPKVKSRVSVADLKSSGVWIEWYEAVAIVQAACRAIIESGDLIGPARIEPKAVLIDARGSVAIGSSGPRSAPEAIQSLGNILSEILPTNDFMLIRVKVASKATSSPPFYHSLEEFSNALSYYERPNRAQLLEAVYDRWCRVPAVPAPPPAQEFAPAIEAVTPESLVRFEEPPDRSRDIRLAAAAGLILLIGIVGAGIWAAGFLGSPVTIVSDRPSAAVNVASPGPATDYSTAIAKSGSTFPSTDAAAPKQSRARTAGSSRGASALTSTPATLPRANRAGAINNANAASPTIPRANRVVPVSIDNATLALVDRVGATNEDRTTSSTAPRVDRAGAANGARTTASTSSGADRAPASNHDKTSSEIALDPITYNARDVDVVLDPRTYNVGDLGVVPPIVVYPQTLVYSPEARREIVATIEVVVNEHGTVDAVRLVKDPRNIGEYLLVTTSLSAVKSWRFRPASKDGHAVKYRTLVPLIAR